MTGHNGSNGPPPARGFTPGALLARVSSDRQAQAGTSLQSQLEAGYAYSAEHGIEIVAAFSDDISGATPVAERPGGAEVYALARSGRIRAVVMYTIDRSARDDDVVEFLLFKRDMRRLGVVLHFVDTGAVSYDPLASVLEFLKAATAADERKKILERTMRGKRARASRGLPMTTAPLAYTSIRNEFGKSIGYEFREELRSWFDELARLFLCHEPYRAMAIQLGANPMTGCPIAGRTVQYIVESAFYRGRAGQGPPIGPAPSQGISLHAKAQGSEVGRHPAVWDEATCSAIEREIGRRRDMRHNVPRARHSPAPLALLDGVLRCGLCGCVLAKCRYRARRPETPGTRGYFCNQSHDARTLVRARGLPPDDWPVAAHRPVSISERRALALIRHALADTTDAEIDTFLAAMPAHAGGKRLVWLEAQIADGERILFELRTELEIIHSNVARRAVEAESERLTQAITQWCTELKRDQDDDHGPVDMERLRAGMQYLRDTPDIWQLTRLELRNILRTYLPDLYVLDGRFVDAPDSG